MYFVWRVECTFKTMAADISGRREKKLALSMLSLNSYSEIKHLGEKAKLS